jgi:hypothetical protein
MEWKGLKRTFSPVEVGCPFPIPPRTKERSVGIPSPRLAPLQLQLQRPRSRRPTLTRPGSSRNCRDSIYWRATLFSTKRPKRPGRATGRISGWILRQTESAHDLEFNLIDLPLGPIALDGGTPRISQRSVNMGCIPRLSGRCRSSRTAGPSRPLRRLLKIVCRRCRRMTPHERCERSGLLQLGAPIGIFMIDPGFHCYSCGKSWGFAFERDGDWTTLEERVTAEVVAY